MEKRLRTMITMFGHEYYYEEHFEFWFEVLFVLLMDKLKRFLEGSVVIPYSDNILEAICTACHSYNKDEDINRFELFENMVECFLTII